MTRAQIFEIALERLELLVEEHGASNNFLASEVSGASIYPMNIGRYGHEIAAEFQRRTGHATSYGRHAGFSFFSVSE